MVEEFTPPTLLSELLDGADGGGGGGQDSLGSTCQEHQGQCQGDLEVLVTGFGRQGADPQELSLRLWGSKYGNTRVSPI